MAGFFDIFRKAPPVSGHRNFHIVEADTHAELGRKLGTLFGSEIEDFVAAIRDGRGWQRKRAAAERLLDAVRHYFPCYVEELQAYAKAAGQETIDVWAMCLEDELDGPAHEHCTTMVTNDGALVSHNEDWDEDSDDSVCVLKKSIGGMTILELYYYAVPLGGCAFSINSHGVIQAINSLNHGDSGLGIPKCITGRFLSESSHPADDLARLKTIPRSSGYAHTLVTIGGDVLAVESTAKEFTAYAPGLPYTHTNHYLLPELKHFHVPVCEDESTFERHGEACRLVRPRMSMDELMRATGDKSNGDWNSLLNCETIGRIVVDLPLRQAKIWLRREQRAGWVDYDLDFLSGPAEPIA